MNFYRNRKRGGYGRWLIWAVLLVVVAGVGGVAAANYAAAATTQTAIYSQGVMANSTSTPERFDNDDDDDDDDSCVFVLTTEERYGLDGGKRMAFDGITDGGEYRPRRSTIDGRFVVESTGAAPCVWRAEADEPWITIASGGTAPAYGESAHQFSINEHARDLKAGTHRAMITFAIRTGFLRGDKHLYVELEILHPCRFRVDRPDYLEFAMQDEQDTEEVKGQTVIISNPEDSAACQWTASSDQSWLDIDPDRGELEGGGKKELVVSLTPTAGKLPAEDGHELAVRFSGGGISENIKGHLDIEPLPCSLSLEQAAELTASGPYGGPFTPDAIPLKLTNEGGKDCRWNAAADGVGEWATITPFSGTIEPDATAAVQLRVASSADALTPGEYAETITFSAGEGIEDVSTTVKLDIGTLPCELTAHAVNALEFRRDAEGNYNRDTAPITISNGAHRDSCRWNASAGDWLSVSPAEGELDEGESAVVTATLDQERAGNLAPQQNHRSSVKFMLAGGMPATGTEAAGRPGGGPQVGGMHATGAESEGTAAAGTAAAGIPEIPEIPASLELACRNDRPCAVIHADRTAIRYGESVETTLTLHNRGDAEIVATLVLNTPSGWSLGPGDFGDCSGGGCTKRARIAAGESANIAVQAKPNAPARAAAEGVFNGNADYHPSGRPEAKETHDIAIAVTVQAASAAEMAAFEDRGAGVQPTVPAAVAAATPMPTPTAIPSPTATPAPSPTPMPTPAAVAGMAGPPGGFVGPVPNPTPAAAGLPDGSRHSDLDDGGAAPFWPVPDLTVSLATISIAAAIALALGLLVMAYRYGRGRMAARGAGGGGGNRGSVSSGGRRGRRGGNRAGSRRRLRQD